MRSPARVSVPLLPKLAVAGGALVVVVDAVRLVYLMVAHGIDSLFNDFYDYWGAAVLLNRGGNPYDNAALTGVLHAAGVHTQVGGGYSYPLLLAQLLRPLGLLAPRAAAVVFAVLSLLALGLAASLVLGAIDPPRAVHAAVGSGLIAAFPPLFGSLYFGQANLIVLVPLALAWRMVAAGPLLAVASAIKVYPITGFLHHLTRASQEARTQLALGAGVLAALLLAPQLGAHGSILDQKGSLVAADPYWTNEAVNGWISRLSQRTDLTTPPFPGLPTAPIMLAVCAVLVLATVLVLIRTPDASASGRLALCLCLGVVIAPKNSLWNYAPLILAVASVWQLRAARWWPLLLTGLGWLLIEVQSDVVDVARATIYRGGSQLAWLSSLALYGALIVSATLATLLLSSRTGGLDALGRRPSRQ